MKRLLTSMMLILAPAMLAHAQDDPEYRMEIGAGVGLGGYLGDFNGSFTKDLEPMASIVGRYVINPHMALKMGVGLAKMKGSSADVMTYYPDYSDAPYTFDNKLYDVCLTYEYNFWPYGTGRDYRGAKQFTPFVTGGIGATYADTADKGKFTFNIPIGLGAKYKLSERVNLALEWALHLSQSDELDGVKDPYYVQSSGLFKNTDCYTTLQLTLTYSFMAKCATCNKE